MVTITAPNPIREKLLKGLAYQKSGEVDKAQRCYKQVLKKSANHPDALNLLGVTFRQQGFPKRAIDYIQKAIKVNPNQSSFYANLARAMMDVGTDAESLLAVSEKSLSLNPNEREALNIRGIALTTLEEWQRAEDTFQSLLGDHPGYADAFQNYGLLLRKKKEFDRALGFFCRAVEMLPDNTINYIERARCRLELEDFRTSRVELEAALEMFPSNGELFHEFARLCFKTGEVEEGLPYAEKAMEDNPDDPHTRITLGVMRYTAGDFRGSIKALEHARKMPNTHLAAAEWNLSLAYLAVGNLEKAWSFHHARFTDSSATVVRREFEVPEWDGSNLGEKTIMVWNDQGIGDALRNASLVHDLMERHDKIIFEAPTKLSPLFEQSFPSIHVRPNSFDTDTLEQTHHDYDIHCCLSDLGRFFRKDIRDFKDRPNPYLTFNKDKARRFYERLGKESEKPIVGISWRSKNLSPWRARWYLSLPDFSPFLETPDVTFVNLQYGALEKELHWASEVKGLKIHNWDDIDLMDDMESAAALTACVDLVVTANTSVADIAGALNIPCWRFGSISTVDLLGQKDPPWYPSIKYYPIKPSQRAIEILPDLQEDLQDWLKTVDISERKNRLGLA